MLFGMVSQDVVIDMSQNVFCMTLISIQMSEDINLEGKDDDKNIREDNIKGSEILLCLLPIDKSK
jgi:hypothetical protein